MRRILFTLGIVAPLCVATSLGEEPQRGTEYRVTWELSEYIFPAPGSSAPPSSTENQWNMYYRHLRTGNVVSSAGDRIDYTHQENGGRGLQLFIDRDTYFNESGQPPRTTSPPGITVAAVMRRAFFQFMSASFYCAACGAAGNWAKPEHE